MLQCKTFEIRDVGTFIPAVGILCGLDAKAMTPGDAYLLGRAGYRGTRCVILTRLDASAPNAAFYDPYDWGNNRTMKAAHQHIAEHWDELESGAVVDAGHLLGFYPEPKKSERES